MSAYKNIFEAATHGTVDDVKYFLEQQRVDVNTKDGYDKTPLYAAIGNENVEVIKFLVANRADANAVSVEQWTPLHSATYSKKLVESAALLISKGAKVNAQKKDGSTPLHMAATHGNVEFVKLLIAKGADVNAKDEDGGTPLLVSVRRLGGSRKFGELTGDHKDEDDIKEVVKYLISDKRVDVNAKDKDGVTPLHSAAYWGGGWLLECAKLLVGRGADINAKEKRDETPLDWAIAMGQTVFIQYLSSLR